MAKHNKTKHKKNKRGKHAPPEKTWSFKRFVLKWSFVCSLWGLIAVSITVAWYGAELPKLIENTTFERKTSVRILNDQSQNLIRYGEMKGMSVDVHDLPPHMIHAVLATEDRRFYRHFGLDPEGLLRATVINVVKGRVVQGGSTITQQLAKNLFLSHDRTIKRKVQEVLLAIWLERELTKDEILTAYLNRVYFGAGAYGIAAASNTYFKKQAASINLYEAATLAGLLKAPSYYNPLSHPQRAEKRTRVVLKAMSDAGYIQRHDVEAAKKYSYENLRKKRSPSADIENVGYFSDYVLSRTNNILGTSPEDLVIKTTLNAPLQEAAEKALSKALHKYEAKNVTQGAVVVMTHNGAIKAMVGGMNYQDSQFNRATQAKRAPGSAFKPFVFLSALDRGWSSEDHILDSPIDTGSYRPQNYNEDYAGSIPLSRALAESRNTATVRLAQDVGIKTVLNTLRKVGFEERLPRDLSLALGSPGVSLLSMVNAYAMIANQGHRIRPYAIEHIQTENGELVYSKAPMSRKKIGIKDQAFLQIKSMMSEVITHGTGKRAALPFNVSGKTGTSQYHRDAWFIGFSDRYIIGVWLGNDDNSPMYGITGGSAPAEIWRDLMLSAHKGKALPDFAISAIKEGRSKPPEKNSNDSISEDDKFQNMIGRLLPSFLSP